jgi:hypothetical protein
MASSSNLQPKVGQIPKADFLPPRIRQLHEARWNRHKLAIATVLVSAICAVGYAMSYTAHQSSEAKLLAAQAHTQSILNAQSHFSDIVSLLNQSNRLDSALTVVQEKDVEWKSLIGLMQKSIPQGGRIANLALNGFSSLESPTGVEALSGKTVAVTVNVTLESPTYQGIEYFLLDSRQWPGYLNGTLGSISEKETSFVGELNILLDANALSSHSAEPTGLLGVGK